MQQDPLHILRLLWIKLNDHIKPCRSVVVVEILPKNFGPVRLKQGLDFPELGSAAGIRGFLEDHINAARIELNFDLLKAAEFRHEFRGHVIS